MSQQNYAQELDQLLEKITASQQPEDVFESRGSEHEGSPGGGTSVLDRRQAGVFLPKTTEPSGLRERWAQGRLQRDKELEAIRIIFDTQLTKLTHQAEAATRESKAFWDAKSVEIAETIKTYVQSAIRSLENDRLVSRNEAITEAYTRTDEQIRTVFDGILSDQLKSQLIHNMMLNLKGTVDRLMSDAIAEKYGLT